MSTTEEIPRKPIASLPSKIGDLPIYQSFNVDRDTGFRGPRSYTLTDRSKNNVAWFADLRNKSASIVVHAGSSSSAPIAGQLTLRSKLLGYALEMSFPHTNTPATLQKAVTPSGREYNGALPSALNGPQHSWKGTSDFGTRGVTGGNLKLVDSQGQVLCVYEMKPFSSKDGILHIAIGDSTVVYMAEIITSFFGIVEVERKDRRGHNGAGPSVAGGARPGFL